MMHNNCTKEAFQLHCWGASFFIPLNQKRGAIMAYSYGGVQQPYMNRFDSNQHMFQQPITQQYSIVRVNGRNGAMSFRMSPNSQCLLLDETQPVVWLCQSDGAGYHTVTPYSIAPFQEQKEPDFNSLESRISRLESMLNEKSNAAANAEQQSSAE